MALCSLVLSNISYDQILLFQIKNSTQLEVALSFLESTGPANFQVKDFEEACGVGMFIIGILQLLDITISFFPGLQNHGFMAWIVHVTTENFICLSRDVLSLVMLS